MSAAFQFAPQIPPQSPQSYPYSPISHMGHLSYPAMPVPYTYPPPHQQMHGPPVPQIQTDLQPPSRVHTRPIPSLTPPLEIKGQDPQSNDMSNTQVGSDWFFWLDDRLKVVSAGSRQEFWRGLLHSHQHQHHCARQRRPRRRLRRIEFWS